MGCLTPVLDRVPRGGWWCDKCIFEGKGRRGKRKKSEKDKEEDEKSKVAEEEEERAMQARKIVSRSGRVVKPKVRDRNEDYSGYRGVTMADLYVGNTKQARDKVRKSTRSERNGL